MSCSTKTIRGNHRWVKVTRDSTKRMFTLALGWEGEGSAHDIQSWGFEWMPTWQDAMEMAESKLRG